MKSGTKSNTGVRGPMPKSVNCYICGRAYGTASIAIHLKACAEKFETEQQAKPKKERRALPPPPPDFLEKIGKGKMNDDELNEINDHMFKEYNEKILIKCENCGRSFNQDALAVHKRLCSRASPAEAFNKPIGSTAKSAISKQKTPGPQKASMEQMNIDEFEEEIRSTFKKQPAKVVMKSPAPKVTSANAQASKSANVKKAVQKLSEFDQPIKKPADAILKPSQEIPIKASKGQKQVVEEFVANVASNQCRKCGRKFAMDRIDKHEKVCKVNSKPKKVKRFHKQITVKEKSQLKPPTKAKWKEQHKNFMEVMKHMRKMKNAEAKGIDIKTIAPLPSAHNSDLIMCKGCSRKFNPDAHSKHEPYCMQKNKIIGNNKSNKVAPSKYDQPVKYEPPVFDPKPIGKMAVKDDKRYAPDAPVKKPPMVKRY